MKKGQRQREKRDRHVPWASSRVARERDFLQEAYFATLVVDRELEEVAV